MAYRLGQRVNSVTIEACGGTEGICFVGFDFRVRVANVPHHWLLVSLAGPIAEVMQFHGREGPVVEAVADWLREGNQADDLKCAFDRAADHHHRGKGAKRDELETIVLAAAMEAQTILVSPLNWWPVSRVAKALLRKKTLSGATIARLIDES